MKNCFLGVLSLLLLSSFHLFSQKENPYAGSPDWYRPGHPLDPAEPAGIKTLPGFKVEKVIGIPKEVGSVTSMALDDQGRIIVGTQHKQGLYRVTASVIGSGGSSRIEPLGGQASLMGWAQGLLYAFDSLYVTVSDKNDSWPTGLYRLLDLDNDGVFDQTVQLLELDASGEHGPHSIVIGPKGESLYMICGNGTPIPEMIETRKTQSAKGFDHLMPPGFKNTEFTDAAWVVKMDPDGSNLEVFASGLRNPYDLAFNEVGDLFTFDSDMEFDLGAPFYRPTRICHIVSGAEFGWRANAGKWPDYYEDSVAPVVSIGPGSPTGLIFGYDTGFPSKYQKAMFALDWTYATVYAVHFEKKGASYTATFESFLSGTGLPLTDVLVGNDGALYVSVGGRKLGSAIYRIWYSGPDQGSFVDSYASELTWDPREVRLSLESYHGNESQKVVDRVWPYLGNEDRAIRYAARIALESQSSRSWRDRVLSEEQLQTKLPALLALARQGNEGDALNILDSIGGIDLAGLSEEGLLVAIRILEVCFGKGGSELREEGREQLGSLRRLLPHDSIQVNRELSRILCYLGDSASIDILLNLMEEDGGEKTIPGSELVERNFRYGSRVLDMLEAAPLKERMHHAQMLNWIDNGWTLAQRQRYFGLVIEALNTSKGGKGYRFYWEQILETAQNALSDMESEKLAILWEEIKEDEPLPVPQGPGRIWELNYFSSRVKNGFGDRDFQNGKTMFAAASCFNCHIMGNDGSALGPNLTGVGQRFTVNDLLESIIHPSKVISDQYQLNTLHLKGGDSVSGRIVSKDSSTTLIATNVLKPMQSQVVENSDIVSSVALPVSTMPPGLINNLNEEEVLDLIAFIVSGGQHDHPLYSPN